MKQRWTTLAALSLVASIGAACGTSSPLSFVSSGAADASSEGGAQGAQGQSEGGTADLMQDGSAPPPVTGGGVPCPSGLACNVSCVDGGTTSVTGTVYDPAGKNPLYNVVVYVPAAPLVPMPRGVLQGPDACSCGALFPSGAITSTTTGADGTFTLTNVPVGSGVPIVVQVGKWRRQIRVDVGSCANVAVPDRTLRFLGTVPPGDTDDNLPDIAASTGGADTLECLLIRIGIPPGEFVPGDDPSGHVHVFTGGAIDGGAGGGTGSGLAEDPPMPGAPPSSAALWDVASHLMPYDVLLLSCEGGETYNANPPALEAYLNAGGRAFSSHFHYAWFAGSLTGDPTVPAPPSDWGSNLAEWSPSEGPVTRAAEVVETLTGSTLPFWKGVMFDHWLRNVGVLGVEGAPPGELPIFYEQEDVGPMNKAQAWLVDDGFTDYMSFDTPVNAPPGPDGGPAAYCGRAVFSDIHVNSDSVGDVNPPPGGCVAGPLSPQETALEFMLFDLSSCVLPDTVAPSTDAGVPPPPR